MFRSFIAIGLVWSMLSDAQAGDSVVTSKVEVGQFKPYNFAVEAVKRVNLSAELSGRIEKIGFALDDSVRAGQVLFEIDRSKLLPKFTKAKQQVEFLNTEVKRARNVSTEGGISASRLNELENALNRAVAERDSVAKELDRTVVVAPFGGNVTTHNLQVGDVVNAGIPLITLVAQSTELFIDVYIPHSEAKTLKVGQYLVANYASEEMQLEVIHVSPRIAKNSSLRAVRMLASGHDSLVPGLRSTLSLAIGSDTGVRLSANSVMFDEVGPYVLVEHGECITRTHVAFDYVGPEDVFVTKGLAGGETVIDQGVLTAQWRNPSC